MMGEVLCPITNEACPHLTMIEKQKDSAPLKDTIYFIPNIDELENEGFDIMELPIESGTFLYEQQDAVRRMSETYSAYCIERVSETVCGVMVAVGLDN